MGGFKQHTLPKLVSNICIRVAQLIVFKLMLTHSRPASKQVLSVSVGFASVAETENLLVSVCNYKALCNLFKKCDEKVICFQ